MKKEPNDEKDEKKEYMVNIVIPEACLNGDDDCPHTVKPVKREYNPV